jgi:polyhydroxybutyrate depolymerase
MEFHSIDDPIAKWNGVPATNPKLRYTVMQGIGNWVAADGCSSSPHTGTPLRGAPQSSSAGETATLVTYTGCRQGAQVALWRFTGSGHVWPGAPFNTGPPSTWILQGVGRGITLVDANEQMWSFFRRYELPADAGS